MCSQENRVITVDVFVDTVKHCFTMGVIVL